MLYLPNTSLMIIISTLGVCLFLIFFLVAVKIRFKNKILVKEILLDNTIKKKWCKIDGNDIILIPQKKGKPGSEVRIKKVTSFEFRHLGILSCRYVMIYSDANQAIDFNSLDIKKKRKALMNYPTRETIRSHFDNEVIDNASRVHFKREMGIIDIVLLIGMGLVIVFQFI